MTFLIFAFLIVLGIGIWFFVLNKDGLGMNKINEKINNILKKDEQLPSPPPPVVQEPPVSTKPEQPPIVGQPKVEEPKAEEPKVEEPILNEPPKLPVPEVPKAKRQELDSAYDSLEDLKKDIKAIDYSFGITVDGHEIYSGFGPFDSFVTGPGGRIYRGKYVSPKVEEPRAEEPKAEEPKAEVTAHPQNNEEKEIEIKVEEEK